MSIFNRKGPCGVDQSEQEKKKGGLGSICTKRLLEREK